MLPCRCWLLHQTDRGDASGSRAKAVCGVVGSHSAKSKDGDRRSRAAGIFQQRQSGAGKLLCAAWILPRVETNFIFEDHLLKHRREQNAVR